MKITCSECGREVDEDLGCPEHDMEWPAHRYELTGAAQEGAIATYVDRMDEEAMAGAI